MLDIVELNENQRRHLIDSRQLWDAFDEALRRRQSLSGGMSWKTVKDHDYLVKTFNDPRSGVKKMTSIGVRSPETEQILVDFQRAKAAAGERYDSLDARLKEQSRLAKAIGIGRVPNISAKILRCLHWAGYLGTNVWVAGTHSLFAYESAAGVVISRDLMVTEDLDLFLEARSIMHLTVNGVPQDRLLDVLRKADRSFDRSQNTYRAVNKNGFFVDLIKAAPTPPWKDEPDGFGVDDLVASPVINMRWLQHAPKFDSIAIAEDGFPVPLSCTDPRAFALYKLWMGTQDPSRDPVKRRRDVAQANVVAEIVHLYLPQLPFEPKHLRSFPRLAVDIADQQEQSFFQPPQPG